MTLDLGFVFASLWVLEQGTDNNETLVSDGLPSSTKGTQPQQGKKQIWPTSVDFAWDCLCCLLVSTVTLLVLFVGLAVNAQE
jgi:hypothetical protein